MNRLSVTALAGSFLFLTGCPREVPLPDAGDAMVPDGGMSDGGPMDGGPIDGGDVDGGPMDGGDVDGGDVDGGMRDGGPPLPTMSEPSAPAEVTRAGTGGYLLRGVVLTPTGALDPGEVLVVGNTITCVAADCSAEANAATVTVVDTHGVISPGLIDGHNHLAYNAFDEWVAPTLYENRNQWPDVASYEEHIAPYTDSHCAGDPTLLCGRAGDPPCPGGASCTSGRNSLEHNCPMAKWGELRSLIHGTTTVMGQSRNSACLDRLVRNADHHHDLGSDHMQTAIESVDGITTSAAKTRAAAFTGSTTRFAVHMQEGVGGGTLTREFESFAGRDPRAIPPLVDPNRHYGLSLLAHEGDYDGETYSYRGVGILIHSMSLTDAQLMEVRDTDSHVVWSPSSNIVLYGATADIGRMLELGINVGLGPDWTVSGEDEMLSEMRFGYAYGLAEGIATLTPEALWRMATLEGAEVVGLETAIGTIEVGMRADLVVFGRVAADPYRAVLDSRAEDVRLVLIDGAGYYGDLGLEVATSVNAECDMIDACGAAKFLCLRNTPGSTAASAAADESYEDVRNRLVSIMDLYDGLELLELIACE